MPGGGGHRTTCDSLPPLAPGLASRADRLPQVTCGDNSFKQSKWGNRYQ